MNTARDLLHDLAVIGATIRPAGDRLILRAGATPVPAGLVSRVREAKAELLATLGTDNVKGEPATLEANLVAPPDWFQRFAPPAGVSPALMTPAPPGAAESRNCLAGNSYTSASSAGGGVPSAMASICAPGGWARGIAVNIGREKACGAPG
jgi:hypothetical protein